MIFLFKQPGLALIRRNQKYIVVGSIPSLLRRRMVSPAAVVAATLSVSDSILRCRKGEWPACSGRGGNDLPRPILFFVAAKKNGQPADRH